MSKIPESFAGGIDRFFNLVWKRVNYLVRSEAKQSCIARLSQANNCTHLESLLSTFETLHNS